MGTDNLPRAPGGSLGSRIQNDLAGLGIGHIPQTLTQNQNDLIRLYKKGSPVGDIIDRVLHPSESNDTVLRDLFSENRRDYADIIQQIRDIVSEQTSYDSRFPSFPWVYNSTAHRLNVPSQS